MVFLSHCLLNENTRYLGGACRGGCVREIVEECIDRDIGIVQMPCPEQHAWGGVTKRFLLRAYGSRRTFPYRLRKVALPLFLLYTRLLYRRLAMEVSRQIGDYLRSGYCVLGVVGVDGSPSCGVMKTMGLSKALDGVARLDRDSLTGERLNDIVRRCQVKGNGLFIAALRKELGRRGIAVPFLAHDLIAELGGKRSEVRFPYGSLQGAKNRCEN
jgi:predicted secreted protein